MAYDGRLLRLAQERYEADRSAREADLAEQREQLYARRPVSPLVFRRKRMRSSACGKKTSACRQNGRCC